MKMLGNRASLGVGVMLELRLVSFAGLHNRAQRTKCLSPDRNNANVAGEVTPWMRGPQA